MNRSMPGLPVHHHLLEFTQTIVYQIPNFWSFLLVAIIILANICLPLNVAFSMRPFWVHTRNLSLPPLSHHSIYHLPILTSITLYCSCLAQAQDIHYTKFCSSFKAPSPFCFMKQWYSFLLFCDHVVDGTREFGPSKPSGFGYFALAIPFRKPIG